MNLLLRERVELGWLRLPTGLLLLGDPSHFLDMGERELQLARALAGEHLVVGWRDRSAFCLTQPGPAAVWVELASEDLPPVGAGITLEPGPVRAERQLGEIVVDSAQVMIGDPYPLVGSGGFCYAQLIEMCRNDLMAGCEGWAANVACLGDGAYPLYAQMGGDGRLMGLRIDLLPDPDLL